MEVWIVMADSWNGEASVDRFDSVWGSEAAAQRYVDEQNAKRQSDYSDRYFLHYEGAVEVRN